MYFWFTVAQLYTPVYKMYLMHFWCSVPQLYASVYMIVPSIFPYTRYRYSTWSNPGTVPVHQTSSDWESGRPSARWLGVGEGVQDFFFLPKKSLRFWWCGQRTVLVHRMSTYLLVNPPKDSFLKLLNYPRCVLCLRCTVIQCS